jgi:hypothetical protein
MSSSHDAHGASAHGHDDHDHFDGEPAKELSPGEPRTPSWLPALGLALFAAASVWLLSGNDAPAEGQPAAEPAKAAAAEPAPAPAPAPRGTAAAAMGRGEATPPGPPAIRKLPPERQAELQKVIAEAQARAKAKAPAQ